MTKIGGDWFDSPNMRAVLSALTEAGFQAYVVGGAVRDALLGRPVGDIDIASDATPDKAAAAFRKAGFEVIPTGIDHGTLTVLAGGDSFEVTTFRRDVASDGRRATVAFSDTILEDAKRRDFRLNALYADQEGTVFDPIGEGLADIEARKIQFIGNAADRIREDYLRILRFYRFTAWISDPADGFDPAALAAIAQALDGLDQLSKERITHEMLRLCAAPDPGPALSNMQAVGVLTRILPGADAKAVAVLVHAEAQLGTPPDAIARLAALGGDEPTEHLRLTKKQARKLKALRGEIGTSADTAELAYRHGGEMAVQIALLRMALLEQPLPSALSQDSKRGADAQFPIKAADLPNHLKGAEIGDALKSLEVRWIASEFAASKAELLDTL